jgi:DMSO/TMAO reductase YedYZ molybdopterin-dependent catalytic subunit
MRTLVGNILLVLLSLAGLAGCGAPLSTGMAAPAEVAEATAAVSVTPAPGATPTPTPPPGTATQVEAAGTATATIGASVCALPTVVVPTLPAVIPGYAQPDPSTGNRLHITGQAPQIDLASYRLAVTGKVRRPLSLAYDALRCMPRVSVHSTLVCPGFFEDVATWAGVPLEHVLDLAEIQPDASSLRLKSADGYQIDVSLAAARPAQNLLAYEWEGEPLPLLHGFPVRAVFSDLQGNRWVKWLIEIEVY